MGIPPTAGGRAQGWNAAQAMRRMEWKLPYGSLLTVCLFVVAGW